jgi:hypothetical protein
MDLHKFCVKFFAVDPSAVRLDAFIPVYHRWIQKQAVEGMLVDVADYGHLPQGPGVMLIAHEADYGMDSAEGPLGLLYTRKTSSGGRLSDRIAGRLPGRAGRLREARERARVPGPAQVQGRRRGLHRQRPPERAQQRGGRSRRCAPTSRPRSRWSTPRPSSSAGSRRTPRSRLTVQISSVDPVSDVSSLLARLG